MNKALFITYDDASISSIKRIISEYVPVSRCLTLSECGNYRPVKNNIEKAISWLRCSKCDSQGLLRCNHGFNHESGVTLYIVVNLPNQENKILSSDKKCISQDYIFSNLFYALPKGVKLWGIISMPIDKLEFKLEKTVNDTFKLTKQNNIPINGDITILSLDKLDDLNYNTNLLYIISLSKYIIFSGTFCINNAFLSPLKA